MSGGSSEDLTRQRGRRGSQGTSSRAAPPGSSLRTPTMAPRRRDGSRMPTTLAVARSSGLSSNLCPHKMQFRNNSTGNLGVIPLD